MKKRYPWSQNEILRVAVAAECDPLTVKRYLDGASGTTAPRIERAAKALGLTLPRGQSDTAE